MKAKSRALFSWIQRKEISFTMVLGESRKIKKNTAKTDYLNCTLELREGRLFVRCRSCYQRIKDRSTPWVDLRLNDILRIKSIFCDCRLQMLDVWTSNDALFEVLWSINSLFRINCIENPFSLPKSISSKQLDNQLHLQTVNYIVRRIWNLFWQKIINLSPQTTNLYAHLQTFEHSHRQLWLQFYLRREAYRNCCIR